MLRIIYLVMQSMSQARHGQQAFGNKSGSC